MANYADSTCLYIIHPWTNAFCLQKSMDNLSYLAEKLKNRGVFVVTETYSTHIVPEFYHLSDLNLLVETNDSELMAEYKRRYEEAKKSRRGEEVKYGELGYGDWKPEHDIPPNEDYARIYPEVIDPYNEEAGEPVFLDDLESVGKWGVMESNGDHRFIDKKFLNEVYKDIETKKTVTFNLLEQRRGKTANFLLNKLKEKKPKVDRILLAGGFREDCVDFAWDSLSQSGYKLRILTKLLVEGVNKSYYDHLKHNSSALKGKKMKLIDLTAKEIVKRYFS